MGQALDIALKFYTNVAKRSKLNVRTFWELFPTFVEVTGEKQVGNVFAKGFFQTLSKGKDILRTQCCRGVFRTPANIQDESFETIVNG